MQNSSLVKNRKTTTLNIVKPIQKHNSLTNSNQFPDNYIYKFGEHESRFRNSGLQIQEFAKIKEYSLRTAILWNDPLFPPNNKSLFYSNIPNLNIIWKRPIEIDSEAKFMVDKYFRVDIQDIDLGGNWILAAITNLTMNQDLFLQVVPTDQNLRNQYIGAFHFRFWQYGKWVDVVVDDQLPTCKGKLIYMSFTKRHEFWGALLEKAYAKLHGSYEALKRGTISEAMEDFTGGVTESFSISNYFYPKDLYDILLKAYERSSIITCSLPCLPNSNETHTQQGLIRGLLYTVTCVKYVTFLSYTHKGKTPLIRLRNTWNKNIEWNGAWSTQSHEWFCIPEYNKEKMGLKIDTDGEFWMSYSDFTKYFINIDICYLNTIQNINDNRKSVKKQIKNWEFEKFYGKWVKGVTAGGCEDFKDTFCLNPQYCLTLKEWDNGDTDNKCPIFIALMQKSKTQIKQVGVNNLRIGITIYQLPKHKGMCKPLNSLFFQSNPSIAQSVFTDSREITMRLKLASGTYLIIPSTYDPNQDGDFLLRFMSNKKLQIKENEEGIHFNKDPEEINKPLPFQIEQYFVKRGGINKYVDWRGLKDILDHAMIEGYGGFGKDVCRSMIAMMDTNYSGILKVDQFKTLWGLINSWKNCFELYDKKNKYLLDCCDLRNALRSVGCIVNNHILNILVRQYGSAGDYITFDDFIMCLVRLRTMIDIFNAKDYQTNDRGTFSLDEWLQNTVYS